jgi:hypothetical protein
LHRFLLSLIAMRSIIRSSAAALVALLLGSLAQAAPVRLIFDTDMQTDCDDAGALGALHALADLGEVEILGTTICVLNPWAAPCTDAINTYYGRPGIAIGQLKGTDGVNLASPFAQGVAQGFPQDTGSGANAPDATAVYRQILANEPGQNVVILSLGYMTNLANLLNSPPDAISPLSGAQLIQQKVKVWICMGGNFPDDYLKTALSDNVNFRRHPASVIDCVANWPGRIEFVGREIGHAMLAGARLAQTPATNPVRRAYDLYFGGTAQERHCADIAAVLYAVRGLDHGGSTYWGIQETGSMNFTNSNAWFQWVPTPDKDQAYVLEDMSPSIIQELLEDLMIQAPGAQPPPTAAITSPPAGSRFGEGEVFAITASATDSNGTVAKVEFFANLAKIGEATAAPYAISWSNATSGAYQLTARATDNEGAATVSAPVSVLIGTAGLGLTGEYFDNANLTGSKLTRIDPTVNFNWGTGTPDPSIGVDSFSVRWTGAVLPPHASGTRSYTFYTNTNDGVRLRVNGQLIDNWADGPLRENSASVDLEAGLLHSISMEFYENTNTAQAELRWSSTGIAKQIIPQTQLFPLPNQTPLPQNDSATADQDLPVHVPVLANDIDPDRAPRSLMIDSIAGGAAGSTIAISGNAVIYTPPAGFRGTDTFTYVATDGQATASGTVSVAVKAWQTFEPFQRRYFTDNERADPAISGWGADPDGDGLTNGAEYSQLTDPRQPNRLPATEMRNGHLVLTYSRRKAATDHTCTPQVSGDLNEWSSGSGHVEETVVAEDDLTQKIEARDLTPRTGAAQRFIRLSIVAQ